MRRMLGIAMSIGLLGGCASPTPSPSIHPTPSSAPVVTCESAPLDWPIHCDEAVRAALTVVPADHPPIVAITFRYSPHGTRQCYMKSSCGGYDALHRSASVIFTVLEGGKTTQMSMYVSVDAAGGVKAFAPWSPYPL